MVGSIEKEKGGKRKYRTYSAESKKVIESVMRFMKNEAKNGLNVPLHNYRKRVLLATGINKDIFQRIKKELEEIEKGKRSCFSSPRKPPGRTKKSLISEGQGQKIRDIVKKRPTLKNMSQKVTGAEIGFAAKADKISKQFLCGNPLLNFDWQNIFDLFLNEDQQLYILNETVNSKLVLKYPLQINYQKLFLKHIINNLEKTLSTTTELAQESVIHDDVYSAYGRLVAAADNSEANYKHYLLGNNGQKIILKESNSLISDGTTGLRTWQASLALSEWIIQNKSHFNEKSVLELGSGIGFTGLVLQKCCRLKYINLTDCHATVLENLCENIKINVSVYTDSIDNRNLLVNTNIGNRCLYTNNDPSRLSIFNLPWEDFNSEICKDLGAIDKVVAADIVYDKDLFKSLLNAIKCLKEYCGVEEFIFSCTERNSETLEEFLTLMRQMFRGTEQAATPNQSIFIWPNDTPIKIYRFKD